MTSDRCEWRRDTDPDTGDVWDGDCGVKWVLTDGTPREHDMNYCPRCGRSLDQETDTAYRRRLRKASA